MRNYRQRPGGTPEQRLITVAKAVGLSEPVPHSRERSTVCSQIDPLEVKMTSSMSRGVGLEYTACTPSSTPSGRTRQAYMRGGGAASDEKGFGRLLEKAPGAWLAGVSSKVQMKRSLRLHSHSCYDPCSYSSKHPISTYRPGRASCLILAVPEERLRWFALLLSVACHDCKGLPSTTTSPFNSAVRADASLLLDCLFASIHIAFCCSCATLGPGRAALRAGASLQWYHDQ